jgi:hypothetical protein
LIQNKALHNVPNVFAIIDYPLTGLKNENPLLIPAHHLERPPPQPDK